MQARRKEKDYGDGYKRYVSEVRFEFKLFVVLCTLMHLTLTLFLDYPPHSFFWATIVVLCTSWGCYKIWHKRYAMLK